MINNDKQILGNINFLIDKLLPTINDFSYGRDDD